MRSRWVLLGFVGGAIAGAAVGLAVWGTLRLAGWPILVPPGSFELLRWGGAGALVGGILGAIFYPQVRYAASYFSEAAIRAAASGSNSLPLLGGWAGALILGAFFGALVGFFAGSFCGVCYAGWDDPTGYTGFCAAASGVVVGAPAGAALGALGALVSAGSGNATQTERHSST